MNPKPKKKTCIIIYLPFSLFLKIGVKDEHFLPDLAQRLRAFQVLALHHVGRSVMISMSLICHSLTSHRMPALRPLHTHHDGSPFSFLYPLCFSCICITSTHCIPHRHCTSHGEPLHPSHCIRAGSSNYLAGKLVGFVSTLHFDAMGASAVPWYRTPIPGASLFAAPWYHISICI